MTLSVALQNARSGLAAAAAQTALAAQNVAAADAPLHARRRAELGTTLFGGVAVLAVTRGEDRMLLARLMDATSARAGGAALSAGLERLRAAGFDADSERALTTMLGGLRDALQLAAARPHDRALAEAAVASAESLATAVNDGARQVSMVRRDADADIAMAVARVNANLAEFEDLNAEIVRAARAGEPASDAMDRRDQVFAAIAADIGVHALDRGDGDMALFLDGGQTLFDTRARLLEFTASGLLTPGLDGGAVTLEGTPLTGAGAVNPLRSGSIAGLVTLRDGAAPMEQRRLDEIARGLVEMFAESDQSAVPTLPTRAGLFTWSGDLAMPGPALVDGLAFSLGVSVHVQSAAGGDPMRLRDGGAGDPLQPAYVYNTTGSAAFSDRLDALAAAFETPRAFDGAAGLGASASLTGFAQAAVGDFSARRRDAATGAERGALLADRLDAAHSNRTGVDLDAEMADLLRVERAYQASARLLTVIDELLGVLIDSVR